MNKISIQQETKDTGIPNWKPSDKIVCVNNIGLALLEIGQVYCVEKVIPFDTPGVGKLYCVVLVGFPLGNCYYHINFRGLNWLKSYNFLKQKS